MQDVWSENDNEDVDRAIALSLAEENPRGNNVNGEWYSSQMLLHVLKRAICMQVYLFDLNLCNQRGSYRLMQIGKV